MARRIELLATEVAELRAEVAELRLKLQPKVRVARESPAARAAGVLPRLAPEGCCSVHGRVRVNVHGFCPRCMTDRVKQEYAARWSERAA